MRRLAGTDSLATIAQPGVVRIRFSTSLGKGVDIAVLGKQKFKKTDCLVLTGLKNTEKFQIVLQSALREPTICQSAVFGEMLDRVFSVVVIPWYAIVVKECKQLFSVPRDPFLQFPHNLSRT